MSFLSGIFGSKPTVPTLPTVSLADQQKAATTANLNELPQAESLVSKANLFSRDQITQMLNSVMPGYSDMTKSASSNISSMLKGEIPQDVSDAVANSAAGRSLGLGIAGSGSAKDLTARDLGLTSLDLTQTGLSSMENWMKTSAALYEPSMMNVQSMFVSPMQMYQTTNEQNLQEFQRNWMQSQINAAPDPVMRGLYDTTMTIIGEALSAYGGGGGYSSSNVAGGQGSSTDFSSGGGGWGMGIGGDAGGGF